MDKFKSNLKLIVQIFFVIIFFSTAHAKKDEKFEDGKYISNYFSGILLLNDNYYNQSNKFFKQLNGLEESHITYSSKYIYSLINSQKFNEAFYYAKKLEKKKLANFESDLIQGVYYLKNKNYDLAQKYFLKLKNRKSNIIINNFISNSLLNWSSFNNLDFNSSQNKIKSIDKKFENLKKIQNAFLHCFYKSKKTEFFFKELNSNEKIDFSRYNYFYATYLANEGKIEEANKIITSSLKSFPRNLLLSQYKIDLKNKNYDNDFDCRNQSHVSAEILYIAANALSTQSFYLFSNFYLNLAKYLNKNFDSFDTLLAENFYKTDKTEQAKKIYNKIGSHGTAYYWYAAKQNAKIFIKEKRKEKALKLLGNAYQKLAEKGIYEKFDYAEFLKNNDQFEESILLYTEIIREIKKDHPLYPQVTDGRGVAYERIGEWNKAEEDLISSLEANPDQAYVINYLAYSWIEQSIKIEKSLQMLEKANRLKSDDPYIIDSLGWALFKLKRYKDSKRYLQLAVKLIPADPTVNDHYGDALWMNGNKIQARYYWNYVLNLKDIEKDLKNNIKNKLISGL